MKLSASGVHKELGATVHKILTDINFDIGQGEFVSLKGRSGSGKSTLLYIASTLDHPTTGAVKIDGVDVQSLSSKELHNFRNDHIGFVFQFHYLLQELTALENILMPTRKTKREIEKTVYAKELLNLFGLSDKMNHLPRQLSGGQCQRVAIARALIMKPQFLFADEPTGNLDSENSETVMEIFEKMNRELKTTILMVTHDEEFSTRAGRTLHLKDGFIIKDETNGR